MTYQSILKLVWKNSINGSRFFMRENPNGTTTVYRVYTDCCTAQTVYDDGYCSIATYYPNGDVGIVFKRFDIDE